MTTTLIDTNILLDIVTDDPEWADWSIGQMDAAAIGGPIRINDVVYAELSVRFAAIEDLDAVLDEAGIGIASMSRAALFLAGKACNAIGHRVGPAAAYCPISSSAHRPRSLATDC